MQAYQGMTESDWKIITVALRKLPIVGGEAPMIANLLQKVEMEMSLLKLPEESRPQVGDIIQQEPSEE